MLKNTVASLLSYGILMIVNMVCARLILASYGSEANGLLSSVNQLFSYLALLEAGIGTATITALYRPIALDNQSDIAEVLRESCGHYRNAAKWYFLCVLAVSLVWPLLIDTDISYATIWGVIFLQGVSGVVTYWYTSTIVNYLMATGKNYVNSWIHLLSTLATCALKMLVCHAHQSIVWLSAMTVGVNVVKCAVYWAYMARKYPAFARLQAVSERKWLKQRGSLLVHEISGVIFSSTDTLIISIFCGLSEASVYAVYSMVFNALRTIIGQVFNSTSYILGNGYSQDPKRYPMVHDRYNIVYTCGTFVCFTVEYWMILPFLSLYTRGIADANYLDPKLPMLFCLIELLSACRVVDNQLIKNAYHAKQTLSRSIIEAAINLVVSVVAVQYLGIYGALLGTIAALLYRGNDIILYANRKILRRSPLKEYALYGLNGLIFVLCAMLSQKMQFAIDHYFQWIAKAGMVGVLVLAVYALPNGLVLRRMMRLSRED